ncbi:MAG: PIN domain-containing protein [Planctomycetales bacterium]
MLRIILYIIYSVVCAGAFVAYIGQDQPIIGNYPFLTWLVLLGIAQFFALADFLIPRKRIEVITAVYFGLLVGILLSWLLKLAVDPILPPRFHNVVLILSLLVLPYLCISLLLQTKHDFRFIIPYVEFSRELKGGKPLILDTSALIDGRIADVIETKILDSEIIVPQFVLHELQSITDSGDKHRRTRGRRGLDVLAKLQHSPRADIRMHEDHRGAASDAPVDQQLVELAKQLSGRIITSDYNLNKIASVQGVDVINLNDVANSLKPRYLPGERLRISVMKSGESPGQGVGYLDDGTMVVCEQASHRIGQEVDLVVTSVLQSSAGRMIFGKPLENHER